MTFGFRPDYRRMIVDVDFARTALVRRRRRPGSDRLPFAARASFSVTEFDGVEAPVALWWTPTDREVNEGTQVAVRYADRAFWQPVVDRRNGIRFTLPDGRYVTVGSRPPEPGLAANCFRRKDGAVAGDSVVSKEGFLSILGEEPLFSRTPSLPLEGHPDVAEVLEDDVEKYRGYVADSLRSLAFVEGVLHERIEMPILKATKRGKGSREKLEAAPSSSFAYGWDHADEFAVTRFEDALAFSGLDREDWGHAAPDVLMPECLTFDDGLHAVVESARGVMGIVVRDRADRGAGSGLAACGDEAIMNFMDLREALDDGAPAVDVMGALQSFVDALRPDRSVERACAALAAERVAFEAVAKPDESDLLAVGP